MGSDAMLAAGRFDSAVPLSSAGGEWGASKRRVENTCADPTSNGLDGPTSELDENDGGMVNAWRFATRNYLEIG